MSGSAIKQSSRGVLQNSCLTLAVNTELAITCSKLTMESLEQGVKYVPS